jgi:TIR domain/SIR2-like domain
MGKDSGTAMLEPDKKFLRPLVERIKGGGCVLLKGPGVAVDTSHPDRPPITSLLARRLVADPSLQGRCPPEMEGNLRYVAQLHYESNRNLEDLAIITADFYEGLKNTTTPFHRHLAELPFRLCINTSPDDFMLEAFLATGTKKPASAYYNFRKALNPILKAPSEEEPLVYYLYGHSRDLYSLVLTESDLIEFLVAIVRGDPPLPDYIKGRLGDPETTFLFVGFGFQNWYLRVLLHVLKIYGHKSRAVALEDTGFFSNPARSETVGYFTGDRLIDFRQLPWDTFAQQLCEEYRAAVGTVPPAALAEPGPGAPKAFLCYAAEDREAIEAIGAALQERGVAIWRDKQNLRTGENWDRVLVDVISKRADYVVVIQSPNMTNRVEGYFRKEIEVALDRFSKFDKSFLFVLPVALHGGTLLPELEKLHVDIEVTTEAGIERLAKTILEDWSKPKRRSQRALNIAS